MQITDISEAFGSEISGLDLNGDLDAATRDHLRSLFDARGVLLFRGLDDLAYADQDRLCRLLAGDDREGVLGKPLPMFISNREPEANAPYGRLMYHADMMWFHDPFKVLSLYAADVAPDSAPTMLTSGVVAWERLPIALKLRIEGLHVLHVTGQVYSRGGDDLLRPDREREESTVTPIAIRHPRTGATVLYVSQQMTREIVDLPAAESEAILQELFGHLYDPALVYEHHWQRGDLVVFDNIAMQHARGYVDPSGPARTLRKVIAPVPNIGAERPTFAGSASS
jgi:taurine dioxygenase